MLNGSVALALGAGMLAALNPCGFALLPAYLTLLVTGDQPTRLVAVARALRMTLAMTAGFTVVFAVFGLVVAPVASSAQRYLPWFSVMVGVVLLGAGLWLLSGRTLAGPRSRAGGSAPLTRSSRSMFGFGVSYAVASLTCTIAPFLAVVVSAFRAESILSGSALFLLYAAGMGLVVGTAAVAVALAQQSLVRGARRFGRAIPTVSGILLVLVGAYVAYYGWWEIRVLGGEDTHDPVISVAAAVQQWLATGVARIGPSGFALLASGLGLMVLTAALRAPRAWIVGLALAWLVLALRQPTTTWHLAPVLLAGVWPWLEHQETRSRERGRRARVLMATPVGLAIAVVVTLALSYADLLRGPTVWDSGSATVEALVLSVGTAVVFALLGLLTGQRSPRSRSAWLSGNLVVDSDDVVTVEGNAYFPMTDVPDGVLTPTRSRSVCYWKGVARYYDVTVGDLTLPKAAWSYAHPLPLARRVKGRVAFWHGVEVRTSPEPSEVAPSVTDPR